MKETITIEWSWQDIASRNTSLTNEQCCKILELIEINHDANIGINWDVIDHAIYEYRGLNQ